MVPLDHSSEMWFYTHEREKRGPFSFTQLREAVASGGLHPDDMVQRQGSLAWLAAKEVTGLISGRETLSDADCASSSIGQVPPSLAPSTTGPDRSDSTVSWIPQDDRAGPLSATTSLLPRIPGYELLGELGKGGMGIVYQARQAGLNRLVALKMIRTGVGAGADELERFRAEAQAVARLQHPNIVQIFEIGEWTPDNSQEAMPYFSLELVSGGSLAQKLAGQPQLPRQGAEMVETLARAMHHAHAHGIIHRDLKPANVLLSGTTEEGQQTGKEGSPLVPFPSSVVPKITDFGLAKELDADVARTQAGAILGTPSYMSPEQAEGSIDRVGPLTDVYALGAILYEMLTGRPPFRGTTLHETLEHVRTREPVSPVQLQPGVPRDLETICLKCLQKEPRQRYVSAEALADDIRSFLDGKPIRARPVSRAERVVRWCRRNPLVASLMVAVGFVTILGFGLVTWKWREAIEREEQETAAKNKETAAKNKEKVAKNEARRLSADLLLQKAAVTGDREGEGIKALFFIVQGIEQAMQADDAELEKSLRRQLAAWLHPVHRLHGYIPADRNTGMAVSPDGKQLWITCYMDVHAEDEKRKVSELSCWDLESLRRLYSATSKDFELKQPAISPDGRLGLVLAGSGLPGEGVTLCAMTNGAVRCQLLHKPGRATAACFDPGSQYVLTGDSEGQIRLWSISTGKQIAQAPTGGKEVLRIVVSPDGKRAAAVAQVPSSDVLNPPANATLWSFPDLKLIGQPMRTSALSSLIKFDASSGLLYVGNDEGTIRAFLASTGAPTNEVLPLPGLHCFALDKRGERRLAGGGNLRAFTKQPGPGNKWAWQQFSRPPHTQALGFSPDESFWFAAGSSGFSAGSEIRLYSLPSQGQLGPPLLTTGSGIQNALLTSDARFLVALGDTFMAKGNDPRWVSVWELHREINFGSNGEVEKRDFILFSPSGRLAVFHSPTQFEIWDTETARPLGKPIAIPQPFYYTPLISDDDRTMVVLRPDSGIILKLDALAQPPRHISLEQPPKDQIDALFRYLKLSPDGRRLAGGNHRGELRLWDLTTSRPGQTLPSQSLSSIREVKFSPDSRFLLLGGSKRQPKPKGSEEFGIEIWDVERSRVVGEPGTISNFPHSILFRPDGKRVWVGTAEGHIHSFDVPSGKPLRNASKQSGSVYSLSVSQDGKVLLAGGADESARLWDVERDQPLGPAIRQSHPVSETLLTPDGQLAVVADSNLTVRLWDVRAGRSLGPVVRPPGAVFGLRLAPDGNQLLIGCRDGSGGKIVKYPLPVPVEGTIAELKRRIERLTGTTLDEQDELQVLSPEEWRRSAVQPQSMKP
jgi:serine/threonine protein kinase/WD40 repeat protein